MLDVRRRTTAVLATIAAAAAPLVLMGQPPGSAAAAGLVQVTGFGSNPGNLTMHAYVPGGLPADAPLVVAMHGCSQDAGDYYTHSGWAELADENGFAVVFPQTSGANNGSSCFNWFQPGDTSRGQGEALSVRQMAGHAVSAYDLDPDRVFVTGLSAGGAMSAVMLATYPDVFAGGSVVAGIPYRCATTLAQALSCMSSPPDRSPRAWGDLVRSAHPGYAGERPAVAIWHGTGDTTVRPGAARESRDQFTDVAGVGQVPTSSAALPGGTTMEEYGDGAVRTYLVEGMPHGTPVDPGTGPEQCGVAGEYFIDTICSAHHDAVFFGIAGEPGDPTDPTDPTEPTDPTDPTDPGDPEPLCITTDNYTHTVEGRAYHSGGYAYAKGSDELMGLWNTWQRTALEQVGPGHWVVGC